MIEGAGRRKRLSVVDQIQSRVVQGEWCQPPAQVFMYNNCDSSNSSILLIIFARGMKHPGVVVKLCRRIMIGKREYENLCAVQDRIRHLSPVPLFFDTIDSFGVLGMSALPGNRISTWDERVDRLPALVDRLISFHRSVHLGNMDEDHSVRCFREPFEAVRKLKGYTEIVATFGRMGEALTPLFQKTSLPRLPQHGDFYFDNILIDGERISVVDWEDFGEIFLPGYDLFCLLLNFYDPLDRQEGKRFFEDSCLGAAMRKGIEVYFRAFGLPPDLAGGILAFTLIQQFLHSQRLGRSSAEVLWHRLAGFVQQPERFDRLFEGR